MQTVDSTTTSAPVTRVPLAARLAAGALIGLAIGTATSFAQTSLDGAWQALANSASPWLLGAFVAGAIQTRPGWAVPVGLVSCVLEVVAYYVCTGARGYPSSNAIVAFWVACAVVGGPLFAWAGWTWRRASARLRPVGGSFLPATFLAEAIGTYQLRLHYSGDVVLYTAIGLALLAVVAFSTRRPVTTACATTAVAIFGIAVYWLGLDAVAGATFGA